MAIFRLVKPRTSERNVSQLAPSQCRRKEEGEGGGHFGIGAILTRWRSVSKESELGKEGRKAKREASEHFENEPLSARSEKKVTCWGIRPRSQSRQADRLLRALRGSLERVENGVGVAESLFSLSSSSPTHCFMPTR